MSWIDDLSARLAGAPASRGCALRAARWDDREFLFALHRSSMKGYVEATWGWDEAWQRRHFETTYAPARHAVVVSVGASSRDIGRVSLTRHWRKLFLRDIELVAEARNRGLGAAIIGALLALARDEGRVVELIVLKCNPAQRLYARLGFHVTADDGERLTMRAR
ncbi:MAG TPA: GNAT family N-acetyltransferase [Casimicrobiaceae bacterium]|nr:GNAT family N-acetyltransferase [Casimicrobiaceae bacterium]